MNAVVYARFSSHRQGEQSIEGQVAEAERFATEHGLTIIHVYADRAQTGRNDNREQFQMRKSINLMHLLFGKQTASGETKKKLPLINIILRKMALKFTMLPR